MAVVLLTININDGNAILLSMIVVLQKEINTTY
jgi:hypothetical protein